MWGMLVEKKVREKEKGEEGEEGFQIQWSQTQLVLGGKKTASGLWRLIKFLKNPPPPQPPFSPTVPLPFALINTIIMMIKPNRLSLIMACFKKPEQIFDLPNGSTKDQFGVCRMERI